MAICHQYPSKLRPINQIQWYTVLLKQGYNLGCLLHWNWLLVYAGGELRNPYGWSLEDPKLEQFLLLFFKKENGIANNSFVYRIPARKGYSNGFTIFSWGVKCTMLLWISRHTIFDYLSIDTHKCKP